MEPPQSENLILGAVPPRLFAALDGHLEPYPLRMRENLQEAGEEAEWVYFPTRGIISVLTVLENGMMIEFATVGREGTTGVPLVVGLEHSNITLVSQMPGVAMRMRARQFMAVIREVPEFAEAVRCYSGVMFALLAQSAACNRAHHVDERCARWLLMTHDQAGGNEFPVTQEFLAQMLGVSRPGVAASAAALQKAGLVSYHRGEMTIEDRPGLERAACECYEVIVRQFDRLRALQQY
jgi:CRP-like cAMP-binding protein